MFAHRPHTIILVTFDLVARVDLRTRKSVEVVCSWRVPRHESDDLSSAVSAGFTLGPPIRGSVYVLSEELWSGQVSVANDVVKAVTEDDLEQTLALQAECESGISPFESRLGHALLQTTAGHTTWWVTQAESVQLEEIKAAMQQAAGQLVAVSSLATLPSLLEAAEHRALDVASPQSCEAFAQAWLSRYLFGTNEVAAIEMGRHTQPQLQQRIGVLTAAAVFATCVVLHSIDSHQLARAHVELSELVVRHDQVRTEITEHEQRAHRYRELTRQREAVEKAHAQQIADLQRMRAAHVAKRKRPVQLLHALATTADPGHWIQSIRFSNEQAVISGLASDNGSVTTLAQRLEVELTSPKWLVGLADLSTSDSTGLTHFKITLNPQSSDALPVSIANSGATDAR